MITRFRLEAEGTSETNVQSQLRDVANEIVELEGTTQAEWEITDSVISLNGQATGTHGNPPNALWIGRIVMKRKELVHDEPG